MSAGGRGGEKRVRVKEGAENQGRVEIRPMNLAAHRC